MTLLVSWAALKLLSRSCSATVLQVRTWLVVSGTLEVSASSSVFLRL